MAKLMEAVQAQGETVTAVALNDYVTEIPMGDFTRYGVVLALKRNGAYMPVRDKGPLFIVYPYDTDSDLRHRRFYSDRPGRWGAWLSAEPGAANGLQQDRARGCHCYVGSGRQESTSPQSSRCSWQPPPIPQS
jgi:hypothetical protein